MKKIEEILKESNNNLAFHQKIETDLFEKVLTSFKNQDFLFAATLGAVLYEMIFTSRLIRASANPVKFIPCEDNLKEQLDNLKNNENEITNGISGRGLSFKEITKKLVLFGVISNDKKNEYDRIYDDIRTPIVHGLNLRLYKKMLGKEPDNTFKVDVEYKTYYEKAAAKMIEKIYEIVSNEILLKR